MSPLAVCSRSDSIEVGSFWPAGGASPTSRSLRVVPDSVRTSMYRPVPGSTETVTSPDAVVPCTSPRRVRSRSMSPDAVRAWTDPPVSWTLRSPLALWSTASPPTEPIPTSPDALLDLQVAADAVHADVAAGRADRRSPVTVSTRASPDALVTEPSRHRPGRSTSAEAVWISNPLSSGPGR